ncbi:DUF4034 domain-containing protein [Dyella telluris]|uniref:DUF4034 domain-containing protein n=1 Tax=Dyella telluris TaxID=2763498 RepID=A0A7G8Q518_9GAMM|nr:DUF4034 domain-containing protein [Dyella telluris]QNK01876.1 DUF4034 domain-containing protein [Dyella telluris]
MKHEWPRLAAVVALRAAVVVAAFPFAAEATDTHAAAAGAAMAASTDAGALDGSKAHSAERERTYAFLAAVKQAEAMADPLQRCLKYPDPPGSHWPVAAVEAYCRYRTQPLAPYDEVRTLLQRGEFAEVERRLAALLQDKLTKPELRNVMDHTFDNWFNRPDLELRPLLENWKQAVPKSAFAYAASGVSYVAMAAHARGAGYIEDTPASNLESMDRLIRLADADLRRAIELDARVTPSYSAMVRAARYGMGDVYLQQTTQAALRADPANFAFYDTLMWAVQPKWGGSLEQMRALGKLAVKHAGQNPVLLLLPEKELGYAADLDGDSCTTPGQFEHYSVIFDQPAVASQLLKAGTQAAQCNRIELSVVYYSESLRFNPDDNDTRISRANELNDFDESAWALKEVDGVVRQNPHAWRFVFSRGYANENLNNYEAAEKDYLAALALDPGNQEIYGQLAKLYLEGTHDWEKLWKLDERMVELFPQEPYVWLLRATVQQYQPRAGLKETADYFEAHFDKSPELHQQLLKMRAAQALQEGKARTSAKAAGK